MYIFRYFFLAGLLVFTGLNLSAQSQNSYIIQIPETGDPLRIHQYFSEKNIHVELTEIARSINAWLLVPARTGTRQSSDISSLLAQCPDIAVFQPNRTLQPRRIIPNDPKFPEQWYLDLIKMPEAWELTTGLTTSGSAQPVIGVLEAGYDFSRTDLQGLLFENPGEIPGNGLDDDLNGYVDDVNGWNFDSDSDDHYIDYTYHGDAVVSIMAAKSDNQVGVAGINWHAKILPLTLEARNTEAATIEAYEYFYQMRKTYNETKGAKGAFIVATNSSFGLDGLFEEDAPLFCNMYSKMGSVGILSVGATSNQDVNVDVHGDLPSSCSSDKLIVVNSIDKTLLNQYSGRGVINVDLAAPAQNILVVSTPGEFIDDSGTSFAAPQISGVISLAYSLNLDSMNRAIGSDPVRVAETIRTCMLQNTTAAPDLSDENATGGYLNALATLQCVRNRYHIPESDKPITFVNLYPNAATESLHVNYAVKNPGQNIDVLIYDMLGREVYRSLLNPTLDNPAIFNVRTLAAGVYTLTFIQNGHASSRQFVKL